MSAERAARVLRALDEIRNGKIVILVDDEDRENEGDLCMAAELVTPEAINFMARHGRGLICLTLTEERIARLGLPMMVHENRAPMGTAFTVSIEARHGVSTGISASDRATTIRAAIARDARPEDIVSPGHVFPLKARRGGVLVRTGQTEGSVDLARLAGFEPAGVICEIMNDDGSMARMPDLEKFAAQHGLAILSIADLIEHRLRNERLVERVSTMALRPEILGTGAPEFQAHVFTTQVEDIEYLALVLGDVAEAGARGEPVLVRAQTMHPLGDVFGASTSDAGWLLRESLRAIVDAGRGVLLYVVPARLSISGEIGGNNRAPSTNRFRDFGLGAQVLAELGVRRLRLLTDNPKRMVGLVGFGIEVVERVPIERPGRPLIAVDGGKG